jgi:hypothetical protein
MKILETKSELVEQKSYPGLFECKMTHKIKETSANFHYTGPKFTGVMWDEILAFFKWTYVKTHGESQVRLFVHPTLGWKAWAFPQEASTGLSTRELPDNPDTKTQRAQFNDEWILYGTVHHHCSASAFQSGTDTTNEKDQEGIHITVGDMDKDVHTLHFRFYYRGCKFQPDMTEFWDVGERVTAKAKEMKDFFGIAVDLSGVAESQMAQTCLKDTAFPEQWRLNLIEKVATVYQGPYGSSRWGGSYQNGVSEDYTTDQGYRGWPTKAIKMLRKRLRKSYKDDIKLAGGLTPELKDEIDQELLETLESLAEDKEYMAVLSAMETHNCKLPEIIKKFNEIMILEGTTQPPVDEKEVEDELKEAQAELEELAGKKDPAGVNGMTDYAGYYP